MIKEVAVEGNAKLLKAEEVAERLDVPVSWVYYAARTGLLPCVKAGRYKRFRPADIERWIETGGVAS